MKLYVCTLTAALVAGFAGWGLSHGMSTARAASGYTAASMKGTFGYTLQGQVGQSTPLAGLGMIVADGNGGLSGSETSQVYGVGTQTTPFQGSYTINNDGTGTMTINYTVPQQDPNNPDVVLPPPVIAHYNFILVNGSTQIKAVRSDNGTAAVADFKLQ